MQVANVVPESRHIGPSPASRDHFNQYALAVKRYELLEADEEQQLARRWQDSQDQRALDALVTSHLRLAQKIARSYRDTDCRSAT